MITYTLSFPFIDQVDIQNLITVVNMRKNSHKEDIIHRVLHTTLVSNLIFSTGMLWH